MAHNTVSQIIEPLLLQTVQEFQQIFKYTQRIESRKHPYMKSNIFEAAKEINNVENRAAILRQNPRANFFDYFNKHSAHGGLEENIANFIAEQIMSLNDIFYNIYLTIKAQGMDGMQTTSGEITRDLIDKIFTNTDDQTELSCSYVIYKLNALRATYPKGDFPEEVQFALCFHLASFWSQRILQPALEKFIASENNVGALTAAEVKSNLFSMISKNNLFLKLMLNPAVSVFSQRLLPLSIFANQDKIETDVMCNLPKSLRLQFELIFRSSQQMPIHSHITALIKHLVQMLSENKPENRQEINYFSDFNNVVNRQINNAILISINAHVFSDKLTPQIEFMRNFLNKKETRPISDFPPGSIFLYSQYLTLIKVDTNALIDSVLRHIDVFKESLKSIKPNDYLNENYTDSYQLLVANLKKTIPEHYHSTLLPIAKKMAGEITNKSLGSHVTFKVLSAYQITDHLTYKYNIVNEIFYPELILHSNFQTLYSLNKPHLITLAQLGIANLQLCTDINYEYYDDKFSARIYMISKHINAARNSMCESKRSDAINKQDKNALHQIKRELTSNLIKQFQTVCELTNETILLKADDSDSIRTILSRLLGYTDVAMIKVKLENSVQEASQHFSAKNIQALIAIYKTHKVDQQTQKLLHKLVGCVNHLNEIDQQLIVRSKHISSNDSEKIAARIIPDLGLLNIRKSGSVDCSADEDKTSRPTTPRIIGF